MELNITQKRDMNHTYVLFSGGTVHTEDYQVQMVLHHLIKGLLPCSLHTIDGEQIWYCENTSLQKLSSYSQIKLFGREELIWIFGGVLQDLMELEEFLVNPDRIYLSPEEVYLDLFEKKVRCCLVPFYQKNIWESLLELSRYLLSHLDHQDQEAVTLAYALFCYLSREQKCMEELWNLLYGRKTAAGKEAQYEPDFQKEQKLREIDRRMELQRKKDLDDFFKNDEEKEKQEKKGKRGKQGIGRRVFIFQLPAWLAQLIEKYRFEEKGRKTGAAEEFLLEDCFENRPQGTCVPVPDAKEKGGEEKAEKDEAEKEEEATALLSVMPREKRAFLICTGSGEKYPLKEPVTVIGKMPGAAQIVRKEATISRIHAGVRKGDDGWYLEDLNSRNGTFINNIILEDGKSVKLKNGDRVCFADVEFSYDEQ